MRFPSRFAIVAFLLAIFGSYGSGFTQEPEPSAEEKKEQLANQRFEEILKKKPRPGTALDRVYEFHITRGSLDEFCQSLQNEVKEKNNGQAALLLGLIQSQRGNDVEARIAFEKAEEVLTEEPLASYYLGKTLLLLGDSDRAIAALQRAIDRKPEKADSLQVFQELGRVYQRLRRSDDAINVWKRMEGMFPGDLQVQEQIASVLEEEGAHAAALERFAALATAMKDRFRKVELGVRAAGLKIKLNRQPEALADFEALLSQINPGSWLHQDIRRRVDESFQSRQDTAGLTAYYQRWIDQHPDDIDAMMRIGRLLSIAHNSAAAKDWFARAIERAPSAVEPRMALVEALERDGNSGAAAKAMQSLSELQPNNPDYLVRWGELLQTDYSQPEAKRNAAAADVWRKLLEKNNDNPVMIARVADLIRSANLSDEAIKLYSRAVELADGEPQYREYLGEYLHRLGRNDEAMKVWRELASGPRKNRDNLVRLSEVLSTFGFKPDALTVMGEACQMQPTFGHRLRYAEKLAEATQYGDALAQLELAGQQATSDEEQDQVLEQEIKVHLDDGNIAKRIEVLEAEVEQGEAAKSVVAWKRLALYLEADGKTQQAHNAIQEAVKLAPQSVNLLNIAARIEEKAGLMGDAVTTLRKLIALDRRGQSRILMQVASIHTRIGQMDQAIKAAQEMLAAADAGIEQYRYYADLCLQAGKVDQGLDALRRYMRANPNNREAIDLLARALSNNFKTEEAIELTWRSFTKANSTAEKTQNVQSLTELYLRSNAFDELVKRLEVYGREENHAREATILTAVAQQASGDLAAARQLLEPLLTTDSRDSELLTTLIELARADGDWDAAANYQTKLNSLSPTPEGGLQLAKFLLEKGDVEQAESIWNKYAGQKISLEDMQNNMRQLLASGEIDKVVGQIERTLKNSPDDWEALAVCMQMYFRCEKEPQAKELATKLLNMKLPSDTLSESAKRQRSRQAANSQSNAGTSPRGNAGFALGLPGIGNPTTNPTATDHMACMNRAMQIAQVLSLERTNPATAFRQMGFSVPSLVCYRDARLVALYLNEGWKPPQPNQPKGLPTDLDKETNVDKLWEDAFLSNFTSSGAARVRVPSLAGMGTTVIYNAISTGPVGVSVDASRMSAIFKRLAQLDDPQAQLWLVGEAMRQLQSAQASRPGSGSIQINPATGLPMAAISPIAIDAQTIDQHLALLKKVQAQAANARNDQVLLLSVYLAGELKRLGRKDESQQLLDYFKQNSRTVPKMSYATALARMDLDLAIDTFILAVKQTPSSNAAGTGNTPAFTTQILEASSFLQEVFDRPQAVAGLETESAAASINRANPLRLITELKKLQAERARRMRPSQLASYTPSGLVRYLVRSNNPNRGNSVGTIPFPAPSALQSSELLTAMFMVQQDQNNLYRAELEKLLRAEAEQADDDAMQSAVDHLCLSIWLWWGGEKQESLKEMEVVRQTSTVNDLASMLASRMYFESGRLKESLAQLESLKPTTAQLMQERELAILQLASQAGDTDLAKQAAERLFAMRLPAQTQMQVANQMQQLGMSEMSASMMQRLQRRGGNQMATLMQMMQQYRSENKTTAAEEIARQILRRTRSSRSSVNTGVRSANDSYRRQALQILAGSNEIKDQIKELEEKVKANPKSTNLAYQLAELYEATGRAQDSATLLAKLQPTTKAAAQSTIASRLNAFRQTRSTDSVQGYLEIFEKNPEYLDREFPYFQMAVQQHRAWDTVAKSIAEWPAEKLAKPSANNFDILLQMTLSNANAAHTDKLMRKLLESENFAARFAGAFLTEGKPLNWTDETQAILDTRICKALADNTLNIPAQTWPNGRLLSTLTAVNNLITKPDSAKKVLETIAPLSEKRPQLKCLQVLMQMTAGDRPGAEKTLEQVRALPIEQNATYYWELASELARGNHNDLAIPLLLPVVGRDSSPASIEMGSKALLLACYEATGNHEQAKPILDECWEVMQKQPTSSSDPFGAAQTTIQNAQRIAELYNQAGYRLEALGVVMWVKQKPDLLSLVERMYGGGRFPQQESLNRLETQIRDKMDAKSVGQLLRRELQTIATATATASAKQINLPVSMLVPDIRTMAEQNAKPASQLRDLMGRLNEDTNEKASLAKLLSELSENNWADMSARGLISALYLADYLQQKETYLAAARVLSQQLSAPAPEATSAASEKEIKAIKELSPAFWLIADKLVEVGQTELAQTFAKQAAAASDDTNRMGAMHMQLRLARSLKDAKQQPAAEAQLRDLLDRLYPVSTTEPATSQPK